MSNAPAPEAEGEVDAFNEADRRLLMEFVQNASRRIELATGHPLPINKYTLYNKIIS
jgi:hypothetical protein